MIGGHSSGHNTGSVGIALLGDHSARRPLGRRTRRRRRGRRVEGGRPLHQPAGHDDRRRASVAHRRRPPRRRADTCPGNQVYCEARRRSEAARRPRGRNYAPFYTEYARRYVDAAYRTFLGRRVDPSGEQYWVSVVTNGLPLNVFTGTLARSDEWVNVSLNVLYQNVFGRPGDPAGMRYWADRIRAGVRLTDVGGLFYGSAEYLQRSGGTNEAFVRNLYRALLLREADQGGVDYWTALLREGRLAGEIASRVLRVDRVAQRPGHAAVRAGPRSWSGSGGAGLLGRPAAAHRRRRPRR